MSAHATAGAHGAATRVLVLNSGSATLKYRLFEMAAPGGPQRLAGGLVDRVGKEGATLEHTAPAPASAPASGRTAEDAGTRTRAVPSGGHGSGGTPEAGYEAALRAVAEELDADGLGLGSPELAALGHRVVHGGHRFTAPALLDDAALAEIERLVPLAPLHNRASLAGIRTARQLGPELPQVAVFDTAFHTSMPEHAARYALDTGVADAYRVRRYGFHGTSHAYVSRRTARLLGRDPSEVNVIVLHLGSGASAAAVRGGRCVDTSMGMTPLEGLVMGTRCGDIDPAVVLHLGRAAGMSGEEIDDLLNARSGLAGLCGDSDMRDVLRRAGEGGQDGGAEGGAGDGCGAARLAFDVYVHRLRKYIGAYCAVLGHVDAVVFTAGVGEHAAPVRRAAIEGLEELGLAVDPDRNAEPGPAGASAGERLISPEGSRVAVAVVPTDEESEIARQTYALVREGRPADAR